MQLVDAELLRGAVELTHVLVRRGNGDVCGRWHRGDADEHADQRARLRGRERQHASDTARTAMIAEYTSGREMNIVSGCAEVNSDGAIPSRISSSVQCKSIKNSGFFLLRAG